MLATINGQPVTFSGTASEVTSAVREFTKVVSFGAVETQAAPPSEAKTVRSIDLDDVRREVERSRG